MKRQLLSFIFISFFSLIGYSQITIDESFTPQELVEDILINSSCAEVANITAVTGTTFGDVNGIAAFDANGTDFPFESGIILSSGDVTTAPGPNLVVQSNGGFGWPGDLDLEANTNATATNNASFIEFDFTPFIEQVSFNFLMMSEEYDQNFECTFTDAFAFILTDQVTGVAQNLAVLPGTNTPIEVTNIHPEVVGQCPAINEEFFGQYNFLPFNDENTSATDFNGQTVIFTAMADVIVANPYTIKLVVADETDTAFDIAVFLEAGSFNIGDADLGDDILVSEGNAICDGNPITLDATTDDAESYAWFFNGTLLPGEINPTLVVTEPGTYTVEVSLTDNNTCILTDDIEVQFITAEDVNLGDDIMSCTGETVTLDANVLSPNVAFEWFLDGVLLTGETNETLEITDGGTYSVSVEFGGDSNCVFTDEIIIDFLTTPEIELGADIESCLDSVTTLNASPSNVDPATATYQWFLDGTEIAGEVAPTLDITAAGTYEVIVTLGSCSTSDTIIVTAPAFVADLGADFNSCFVIPETLEVVLTDGDLTNADIAWSLDGTVLTDEEMATLEITVPGTYTVVVTLGICTTTDEIIVIQANDDGSECSDGDGGSIDIDAGDDVMLDCDTPCTDLTATFTEIGETSTYTVTAIPFNPPAPFTGGTPVSVNTDDVWSDPIDLPFTFCFFETDYDQAIIGSNGVVSFDLASNDPGGFCNWSFEPDETIPDPAELFLATIFGPYMDIDPSVAGSGQINFSMIGEAPTRAMVINFPDIPYFSCNELSMTSQIVIYEFTNIIDVYVQERSDQCPNWNDGLAVLGIQNQDGTLGFTPPDRNTGNWEANMEAWRFTPAGPSVVDFAWLDPNGEVIGTDTTINVCPEDQETIYTAQATYTNCDGETVTISDDVTVIQSNPDGSDCTGGGCDIIDAGEDQTVTCDDPCVDLTATLLGLSGTNSLPLTDTSSYIVEQVDCPLPPIDGGTPTGLTIDDQWSDVIDLPFSFSFYGVDYSSLVVGANGQISFNTAFAGGFNGWNSEPGETLPFTDEDTEPGNEEFPLNTIYGAYHDINPATNGDPMAINFFVAGEAPFRTFVLNFDAVPQFSCTDLLTTQQIILYESFNIIDVNIIDKPVCDAWNDGLATLGIQGNDLTQFTVPPGRNTDNWAASNESWRFVPNGAVNEEEVIIEWTDEEGTVISNELTVNVCPTTTTTYTVTVFILDENGEIIGSDSDDVTVFADDIADFSVELGDDVTICDGTPFEIIPLLEGDVEDPTFLWSTGETTETITVTTTDTYSVEVTVGGCTLMDEITVTFIDPPTIDLGPDVEVCGNESFEIIPTITGDLTGATFLWSTGETTETITVTETDTYTLEISIDQCVVSDSIVVTFIDPPVVELGDDIAACSDAPFEIIPVISGNATGATFLWSTGETTETITVTETDTYSVEVTVGVCTVSDMVTITFTDPPVVDLGPDELICNDESFEIIPTISGNTDLSLIHI